MLNKKKKRRKRKDRVLQQVRNDRQARRQIELEQGIKKQAAGYHQTSKKDKEAKQSNTVRDYD